MNTKIVSILTLKTFALSWGMIALFVLLNSYGSITLKSQIQQLGNWNFDSPRSYLSFFTTLFSHWKTWIAFSCIGAAMLSWILALLKIELSAAYPVAIGFNFLLIVGFSVLWHQESFTLSKAIGIFFILVGATILFATEGQTT